MTRHEDNISIVRDMSHNPGGRGKHHGDPALKLRKFDRQTTATVSRGIFKGWRYIMLQPKDTSRLFGTLPAVCWRGNGFDHVDGGCQAPHQTAWTNILRERLLGNCKIT